MISYDISTSGFILRDLLFKWSLGCSLNEFYYCIFLSLAVNGQLYTWPQYIHWDQCNVNDINTDFNYI